MYRYFFKRVLDIVCALLALTVFSPLFVVLMIVGAIEMRGNPFFIQQRPGYHERIFKLIKFRTMTNEKDTRGELLPDELRLNKYGKFLRTNSLDELPEALNILVGDMSVVGPRPLLVQYLPLYTEEQHHRHDVRPGLSGYAQINGRNIITWTRKFELDCEYVRNVTLWMDISIVIMTVKKAFLDKEGITSETSATIEDFNGTN